MDSTTRALVRAGDPVVFGSLFDEYAAVVYRHAMRLCGDRVLAEDVVSLTFLEAWRLRRKVLAEGGSLLPWLLGIATNVLRNTTRAARRHREALGRVRVRDTVPDFADDVVDRIHDDESIEAVRVALASLRRSEREVFTLCVWEGLDYAAAAVALGVPVGTVRSRLSRARTRLRKLADEELSGRSRELHSGCGQVPDSRVSAARSTKEGRR
ncbi:RNA polymerase sigma factor [Lentzea sp. NPDC034063]|uniref:RNA polymerase sigma factor n=1 Tax=unclassified Lentzea TaxID=2643253 RepID=UPI0033C42B5A